MRIEGRVERVAEAESDAYYAPRPLDSRLGAWASPQSQPITRRAVLESKRGQAAAQHGLNPPRPPHQRAASGWIPTAGVLAGAASRACTTGWSTSASPTAAGSASVWRPETTWVRRAPLPPTAQRIAGIVGVELVVNC